MKSKYLDLKRIHDTSDGDLEFERDLIEMFLEDIQTVLEKLDQGFQTSDLPTIRQMAHTIKGSSANIGASALERTAAAIEDSVMAGTLDHLLDMKNTLMASYCHTKEALGYYLTGLESQLANAKSA